MLQNVSCCRSIASLKGIIERFFDGISWIGGFALTAIMVLTTVNVLARIPGAPIQGTVEITSLLFVVVVAFGIGSATLAHEHVEINLLVKLLPLRLQQLISVLINIGGIGIWVIILWRTLVYAIKQYKLGEYEPVLNNMALAPWRFAFIFGLAILCLALLILLIESLAEAVKR